MLFKAYTEILFEKLFLYITYIKQGGSKNSGDYISNKGTAVAQWLRYCATNRKVAGSIPAGVSGFFIDIKSF